jgi:Na+/melibiose symporter-like transporter
VARDHLDEERVHGAVMLLSISTVAGAGIGYPVSGALAAVGGVVASFWFGAVVVTGCLVVAARVLPDGKHLSRSPLDVRGAVLLGAGVAGTLLALSQGRQWGWGSPTVLALVTGSALLVILWTLHERRVQDPLVDLRLLRLRPVLVADVTALAAGVGVYLLMSSVSWLLQSPGTGAGIGFGQSPLVAACAMVPFSVTSVATARLLVPRLVERVGDAWTMPLGCALFCVAMVGLALFREETWQVFVIMGLGGMGAGCTFSSMPAVIVGAVPPGEFGSATGVNQVLRTIGYATGSAVFAAVLAAYAHPGTGATPAVGFDLAAYVGAGVFAVTGLLDLLLVGQRRHRIRTLEPELLPPP